MLNSVSRRPELVQRYWRGIRPKSNHDVFHIILYSAFYSALFPGSKIWLWNCSQSTGKKIGEHVGLAISRKKYSQNKIYFRRYTQAVL